MKENIVALLNYSKKMDGTSIAARKYYDELSSNERKVKWYQLADSYEILDYLQEPAVLSGSRIPVRSLRTGYDRLIYFPGNISRIPEDFLFLSDPSLIKLGLKKKGFMIKMHDLIPISEYYEFYAYKLMFKYALKRLKKAETVVVTTHHMKRMLEEYIDDIEKISIVRDPVPDFALNNNLKNRSIGDTIEVLYVAADRPYKEIRKYMDLAKFFQDKGYNKYNFTLISKLFDGSKQYLKNLGLRNLTILSNLKDLREVYSRSDIFVCTSLQEGFGRPNVEAMSAGIPVLTRKIEPFLEILGSDGEYVEEDNLVDWAEGIMRLSEPINYREISGRLRKRYLEEFSMPIFGKQLLKAYDRFVERVKR